MCVVQCMLNTHGGEEMGVNIFYKAESDKGGEALYASTGSISLSVAPIPRCVARQDASGPKARMQRRQIQNTSPLSL